MTGHLGGLLRIDDQTVLVRESQTRGDWTWGIDYYKFRGRGGNSTENFLGADGLFEVRLNLGGEIQKKSLLFQSKLDWQSDRSLLTQCIKLSTWREAAFVVNYTSTGFNAYALDDVIRSRGNRSSGVQPLALADYLGNHFLMCLVGDDELSYNARTKTLVWKDDSGEMISTRFRTRHRLAVNVSAPNAVGSHHAPKQIPNDQIYDHRMEATNEEILSLPPGQTKSSLKATRKALVLTYHPDRMNEFDELERLIFNRRMAEINNAYDELRVKQGQ